MVMVRRSARGLSLLVGVLMVAGWPVAGRAEEPAPAPHGFSVRPSPQRFAQYRAKPPRVAMLVTGVAPEADRVRTQLLIQRADASRPDQVAALEHPSGSIVRGALIPGTHRAAVSVDLEPAPGSTWSASLVMLEARPPSSRAAPRPTALIDRLYLGAAPLVLEDGRVIVQRGEAGSVSRDDLEAQRTRVDRLMIDAVLPDGSVQHLREYQGYIAHLAGAIGDTIVVYLVGEHGASLLCLGAGASSGSDRRTPLPPYASDFTPNRSRKTILFSNRAPERRRWTLHEVDASCRSTELADSDVPQVPSVWRGGAIAFARRAGTLEVLDAPPGATPRGAPRRLKLAPSSAGSRLTALLGMSPDQSWALGVEHTEAGPRAVAVYARGAERDPRGSIPIVTPPGTRVEMLEVLP